MSKHVETAFCSASFSRRPLVYREVSTFRFVHARGASVCPNNALKCSTQRKPQAPYTTRILLYYTTDGNQSERTMQLLRMSTPFLEPLLSQQRRTRWRGTSLSPRNVPRCCDEQFIGRGGVVPWSVWTSPRLGPIHAEKRVNSAQSHIIR